MTEPLDICLPQKGHNMCAILAVRPVFHMCEGTLFLLERKLNKRILYTVFIEGMNETVGNQ